MPTWVLLAVIGVGVVHLWTYYGDRPVIAGTVKALPILLLAAVALTVPAVGDRYALLVATGLVFSAVGDVCLVSKAWFVPGLASFLVGHLSYLAAFVAGGPALAPHPGWLAGLALVGGILGTVLWRHAGRVRVPVAAYVVVIALMAWAAVSRAGTPGVPAGSGTAAAVGALLFMLSDAILATNRFVRPLPAAHAWVMLTYYAAQTAIASSVAVA